MSNEIEYWQSKCQEMNERLAKGEKIAPVDAMSPFQYLYHHLFIKMSALIQTSKDNKLNYNKLAENGER